MFILNTTDRYRLETLAELGARFPDTVSAAEVARRRDIPAPYLAQLARELARRSVIRTRRGPGGGLALARPPREIPLDEVLVNEISPAAPGVIEARLTDALRGSLQGVTVADLVAWELEVRARTDYAI